jgi:hypothetical protein
MRGVLLGVLLAIVVAVPASAEPIEVQDPLGCRSDEPIAFTPPPFADPIDVRVLVLLDGVTEGWARTIMAEAGKLYEPLALRLRAVAYRPVSLTVTDADAMIQESKDAVGGGRPAGADLVFTFTDKNMTGGVFGDGVAGMVDCVGGVVDPDRAFGVGEMDDDDYDSTVIAAHELGHLLGAHHHFANCAESDHLQGACTVMINDIGLASLRFSSINGGLIRGHAETYLPGDPYVPPKPEPEPEPEKPEPAPAADPGAQPAPAADPQPAPEAASPPPPAPAPAPATQRDADQERLDELCVNAVAALGKAQRAATAARRRVRRRPTRARRQALRRAVVARERADRAMVAACQSG